MTPGEVAQILKVSEQTVHREINRGELEAFAVAKRWRIRREALEAYLHRPAPVQVIDPEAVTTLQVSDLLHCSREAAWRLMAQQTIPARRDGRAWVARLADVEAYRASMETPPTS
ncbi:hypothetical protein CGZ93_10425 [Enemella dayhoffiae]|uniref:Helix-turn-helix domain-containing protein n=2 Tax=Enemella dayhoffiae TaxID=2016507 RepID=A0A255H1B3_9ACTN|nr:hypothetical protein CGZ93_10425 [Enemella dayhoffiae]